MCAGTGGEIEATAGEGGAAGRNEYASDESVRMIRLLAIDLDGTLLDAAGGLAARDADALRDAAQRGVFVVIASGRAIFTTREYASRLPCNAPWVLGNGSLIVQWPGPRIVREHLLDCTVARRAAAVVRRCGLTPMLYDNPGRSSNVYMESAPPDIGRYIRRNEGRLRFVSSIDDCLDLPALCVIAASADEGVVRRAAAELERALGPEVRLLTMPNATYRHWAVEVLPRECSKGRGLQWVAERLGVESAHIAAFGDDVNDLPMLEYAGTAVAMSHAPAEVRAAADVIATPDDGSRIAEVLSRLLESDAQGSAGGGPHVSARDR